jgi:hypothetical protein
MSGSPAFRRHEEITMFHSQQNDVETFEVGDCKVRIMIDSDPESPRDWDNLGTMICHHRKYTLGDKHRFNDPEDFSRSLLDSVVLARLDTRRDKEESRIFHLHGRDYHDALRDIGADHKQRLMMAAEKRAIILPLFLYDHSGIAMRTQSFSCPWDSGQVGFIYVLLDKARADFNVKRIGRRVRRRAIESLEQEVKTYSEYLQGEVYGYTVEREDGETIDSCFGFFGFDLCKSEATSAAQHAAI